MKYKLGKTKTIHWDNDGIFQVNLKTDIIQRRRTAEIYAVSKNILPIIIEGQIKIKNDKREVFSCIFHTKCLLTFEPKESPISDLIKMFIEADSQEDDEWANNIANTRLEGLELYDIESDQNVKVNKACEIRDIARQQNLLT